MPLTPGTVPVDAYCQKVHVAQGAGMFGHAVVHCASHSAYGANGAGAGPGVPRVIQKRADV